MNRRELLTWLSAAGLCQPAQAATAGKDDIVFGQTADFSASRAAISQAYSKGAALHFNEVNAAGGIYGRRIRILQLDDGYDSARAEQNVRALTEEHKVFALVHMVGTAITGRLLPYVAEKGVPMVHPITGADELRAPAKQTREAFFLRASYGREIQRVVGHMKTLGIHRIGLVHEDEPFGHGIRDAVLEAMKEQQLSLLATGVLPPNQTSETGVAQAVQVLRRAEPSALIIGSAGPVVERFIKAYHGAGGRSQYYGLSVTSVERLFKELGTLVTGMIVAQVLPDIRTSNLPVVRNYRDLVARSGGAPASFGLEGYISARMIVQALKDSGPARSRTTFMNALANQTQIGGFPVKYQDSRQGSPFVELAMIGDGGKLVR